MAFFFVFVYSKFWWNSLTLLSKYLNKFLFWHGILTNFYHRNKLSYWSLIFLFLSIIMINNFDESISFHNFDIIVIQNKSSMLSLTLVCSFIKLMRFGQVLLWNSFWLHGLFSYLNLCDNMIYTLYILDRMMVGNWMTK